jgi:hypothetical protein
MKPEELEARTATGDPEWYPLIFGWSKGIHAFYRRVLPELPDGARCVEVGVYHGRSVLYLYDLLRRTGNTRAAVWAVDAFVYYEGSYDAFIANMRTVVGPLPEGDGPYLDHAPKMSLIVGGSVAMASHFDDASLDLVFIDAGHSRADVTADMAAWVPKLKANAILAGHDIDMPEVRMAVVERFGCVFGVESGTVWSLRVP